MPPEDIERTLGRIEQKIDSHIDTLNRHFADDERNFDVLHKRIDTTNERIGNVEKKTYFFSGLGTAAGTVIGYIVHGFIPPR